MLSTFNFLYVDSKYKLKILLYKHVVNRAECVKFEGTRSSRQHNTKQTETADTARKRACAHV